MLRDLNFLSVVLLIHNSYMWIYVLFVYKLTNFVCLFFLIGCGSGFDHLCFSDKGMYFQHLKKDKHLAFVHVCVCVCVCVCARACACVLVGECLHLHVQYMFRVKASY